MDVKKEKKWTAQDFGAFFSDTTKQREFTFTGIEFPGWFNVDAPYKPFLVSGDLGEFGAGAVVWCVGKTYPGRSRGTADEMGIFGVMAQANEKIMIKVTYQPAEGFTEDDKKKILEASKENPNPFKTENFGPFETTVGEQGRALDVGRLLSKDP